MPRGIPNTVPTLDDLKARERAKRWREENPERYRENQRRWRGSKRGKQSMQRGRLKWRAKNPERVREINRRWARNMDPDDRRFWNTYNRLRRRGLAPTGIAREFTSVLLGDPCAYCGEDADTIDHIEPIARGGDGSAENLTAACARCNKRKNDRPVLTFMLARLADG